VCVQVGHETLHSPGHHQHVRALLYCRPCQAQRIVRLRGELDREGHSDGLAHPADIIAHRMCRSDLSYGGSFAAVRRTQVQFDPAQPGSNLIQRQFI
jgi:hypothetical protein